MRASRALWATVLAIQPLSAAESVRPSPSVEDCRRSPQVLSAVAPEYPQISQVARIIGQVSVEVSVGESGQVLTSKVGPKSHPMLTPAVLVATSTWKFDNAPGCAERTATLMFRFRIVARGSGLGGTVFRPPFEVEISAEEPERQQGVE